MVNQSSPLLGLLFAALALIVFGFGVALSYESLSFFTRREPTISAIVAGQLAIHPHWGRMGYLLAGVVIGALATHFSHWTP